MNCFELTLEIASGGLGGMLSLAIVFLPRTSRKITMRLDETTTQLINIAHRNQIANFQIKTDNRDFFSILKKSRLTSDGAWHHSQVIWPEWSMDRMMMMMMMFEIDGLNSPTNRWIQMESSLFVVLRVD